MCSAVLPGRSAGQHQPGLHQDTEEELVLDRLRDSDDAVLQHPRQGLKILQIASLDRTEEPGYLVTGMGAGHSTRLPGCACRRRALAGLLTCSGLPSSISWYTFKKLAAHNSSAWLA